MEHHQESCHNALALLSDYVDFELPLADCREVERHLADCPICREFVDRLRDTIALCREYKLGGLPAPLTDHARTALESAWRHMLTTREHRVTK
jgi:RNA polymerase sigma-70 factor (ECF subfamily)